MTDTQEIKKAIRKSGHTLETLANEIGISRTSLSYKINNVYEFTATEIKTIQKTLNLSDGYRDFIFFRLE